MSPEENNVLTLHLLVDAFSSKAGRGNIGKIYFISDEAKTKIIDGHPLILAYLGSNEVFIRNEYFIDAIKTKMYSHSHKIMEYFKNYINSICSEDIFLSGFFDQYKFYFADNEMTLNSGLLMVNNDLFKNPPNE